MASGIDWNEVDRENSGKRSKRYASRTCPVCGKTIREGAWGATDSNWKKHSKACEKKRASHA